MSHLFYCSHIKYNQLQSQLPKSLNTQQEKFLKEVRIFSRQCRVLLPVKITFSLLLFCTIYNVQNIIMIIIWLHTNYIKFAVYWTFFDWERNDYHRGLIFFYFPIQIQLPNTYTLFIYTVKLIILWYSYFGCGLSYKPDPRILLFLPLRINFAIRMIEGSLCLTWCNELCRL